MPPPVTCAKRVSGLAEAANVVEVEPRGGEQVRAVVVLVPEDAADEREAVRVDARGRQPDDDVTRRDRRAVDHAVALDDAHARAREVELALPVDARQLGRLPADQRDAGSATDLGGALHELHDLVGIDLVRGHVVEQHERVGAARRDVVDAVGGEIGAAIAQSASLAREHELRPHGIGRRREQPRVVERMEAREGAEAGGACRLDGAAEPLDDVGALVDGDAGLVVRPPAHAASLFSAL